MPTVKIDTESEKFNQLVVDGKALIQADEIFEFKLFAKGKRIAVVYKTNDSIFIGFIELDRSVSVHVELLPTPPPGFVLRFLGKPENTTLEVLYPGPNGNYYLITNNNFRPKIIPESKLDDFLANRKVN